MNVYTSPVFRLRAMSKTQPRPEKGSNEISIHFSGARDAGPLLQRLGERGQHDPGEWQGMDREPARPVAQAVALDGSKILAVGDDTAIRKLAGPDTAIVDLHGRLLLPGFMYRKYKNRF